MPTATLLLSCPDATGIVAAVATLVSDHGGNIIHADQHTDVEEAWFVQRVEWQLDGFDLDRDEIVDAFRPIAERYGMEWRLRFSDERRRIALMVSQQGHCMFDLLARWRLGELPVDIAVVISNHEDLRSIADDFGVPYHHIPVPPDGKRQAEAAALAVLAEHDVDLVVLARYMQILTPEFISAVEDRIINIHHSFLPAFAGGRPYHQAHERGVKVIGATAHFVTLELDAGPIIEQAVTHVSHRDSVADLVRKGRDLEKVVLARAVRFYLENRIVIYRDKTVIFD
jgi:formyltetrahydrofolate deformylase